MCAMDIPNYQTDAFFNLEDHWLETAPGELTHFHQAGAGTPILFLHGSGTGVSAAANWWLNLNALADVGHCYAIDSIGYGQTVVADGTEYGIKAWVDHAIRFLDKAGIEKTWVVGNSLGGWLAFQMALDYPERLHGIISMGTGGAAQTAALKQHANPELSVAGIKKTLLPDLGRRSTCSTCHSASTSCRARRNRAPPTPLAPAPRGCSASVTPTANASPASPATGPTADQ